MKLLGVVSYFKDGHLISIIQCILKPPKIKLPRARHITFNWWRTPKIKKEGRTFSGLNGGGSTKVMACRNVNIILTKTKMADDHGLSSTSTTSSISQMTSTAASNAPPLKIQAIDIFRSSQLG